MTNTLMLMSMDICRARFMLSYKWRHSNLHSFPTRRSSDLFVQPELARTLQLIADSGAAAFSWSVRSEEHTSELQSRLHLVCRLLLEKKKLKMYLLIIVHVARAARHGVPIGVRSDERTWYVS